METLIKLSIFLLIPLLISACDDPDIITYQAEKKPHREQKQQPSETSLRQEPHNHSPYTWDLPTGWKQKIESSMRIVTFTVPKTDLDISIVQLGPNAGTLKANINRWRGQLSLPDHTDEQLQKEVEEGDSGIGKFKSILIKGKTESILAATYYLKNATLFIKVRGKVEHVTQEKNRFDLLCKSIRPNDHKH